MKNLIAFLLIAVTVMGCKNDSKNQEEINTDVESSANDVKEVSGNFMYNADAAVFQTKSELYGVVENEMLQDLILQSEPLKTEPSDEVVVTLKVKISKKPKNEEGWDNRIEILEIKKVSKADPNSQNIIKLGTENAS